MRVLVACEWSGAVRRAFRKRGHEAWSCDLEPAADESPFHIRRDAREVLGESRWDMLIAFPPCTHLAVSGAHRFKFKQAEQVESLAFVQMLMDAPIEKIALENPVGIISSRIRKPDQIIQPWQFGHPHSKKTCLWIKGLPLLRPTNILQLPACGYWENQTPSGQNKLGPSPTRAKERGKTYEGIAQAMAEQWG